MAAPYKPFDHFFRHAGSNEYLWKYGTRVWFPKVHLQLKQGKKNQKTVAFKTDPRLTKFEIKQFLTKVYGLHIKGISTLNYEKKIQHYHGGRGNYIKSRSGYKKAYVTLSEQPVPSIIYTMMDHANDIKLINEHVKNTQLAEVETTPSVLPKE
jgi:ribosomal protein L23